MHIGMIVYSHTGHTLSVCNKLKERLSQQGHLVMLVELVPAVPLTIGMTTIELKTIPDISPYNVIILGTPVRGGTPSPPMKAFIKEITSFNGKMVAFIVTGFFPAKWGRNQTLAQLSAECQSKQANILGAESVGWWRLDRKSQINKVVENISDLFSSYSPDTLV